MNFHVFRKQLSDVKTLDKANRLFRSYLAAYRIQSYAFTYYSLYPSSGRKLLYEYASPPLKSWHQHYIESDYTDIDQTLQWSRHAIVPEFWDVQVQLQQARTPRERRLRLESIEYGIDRGLQIPIHGPREDFAVLTIHQRADENGLDDHDSKLSEWFLAAHHYYASIRLLLTKKVSSKQKYPLTKREIQCLKLTGQGLVAADIAKKLSISERTVHYHMQNVNKKFGTKHKYQSLAKAMEDCVL